MQRAPRLWAYAAVVGLALLTVLPTFLPPRLRDQLPGWAGAATLNLGLDLRGGAHLVLALDEQALQAAALNGLAEDVKGALADLGRGLATVQRLPDAVLVRPGAAGSAAQVETALDQALPRVQTSPRAVPQPSVTRSTDASGAIRLVPSDAAIAARREAALGQSLEILRRRIDEVGIAEPILQRVGGDRLLVQIPGAVDPTAVRKLLGTTAELSFHRVAPDDGGGIPADYLRMPGADGGRWLVERVPVLSGEHLADATAGFDPRTREPSVSFRFDGIGARRFGHLTQELVGQPFAIVLDGKVLSAPIVREPILGGRGQITGRFTVEEATRLAALLRAGALPVSLEIVEQRIVGPDLGQDAIGAGLWSGAAGFGLVAASMIALFGGWGAIAAAALVVNVVLTLAALALLGGTLTLPGIAGIVLGLGLAVDANVLINARIREELRAGRSPGMAVKAGFANAYRAILDGNLTTLLATAFLFAFGVGPVRGFAVTMAIGVAGSMLTAVSLVRALMETRVRAAPRRFALRPLWAGLDRGATTTWRFVRHRFVALAVSGTLSLASLALVASPGLNYGVDFAGGIMIEAQGTAAPDLAALRHELERADIGAVRLQTVGDANSVLVRLGRQPGGEKAQDAAMDAAKAALHEVDPSLVLSRVEAVGPKVSGELARVGVLATVGACVAMFGYLWLRFDWPFAVGAIATIVLDVVKTLGFFALTGLDFDLTAVAALLTLIGYSVNDKVVVYDRIRENLRRYKALPLEPLIDRSINETLGRSLATSLTTALALVPMAFFGGTTLASFAWAMLFGVGVATLSSVFLAAPAPLLLADARRRWRAGAVDVPPAQVAR